MGPQGYLSTAVVQRLFCQDEFELGRKNGAVSFYAGFFQALLAVLKMYSAI